ncbi:hypothetical protein, partial [Novosphingobium sp. PhB57]|uniref:hypothetical protein n=1 Tax=Novosphingobium sp. PhB57 TaxID=2485107 RepID=UPI001A9F3FAF
FAAHVRKQPFAPVIAAAHLQSFNLGRGDLNHLNGLKGSSFFRRLLTVPTRMNFQTCGYTTGVTSAA